MEQLFREDLGEEDKVLFKKAYDMLQTEVPDLLAGVTWLSPPELPNTTRRRQASENLKHRTGCARTEGFYSVSSCIYSISSFRGFLFYCGTSGV